MTKDEFTKYILDICTYYERRLPKDAAMDLWFKKMQYIPVDPLSWIYDKITENAEPPKNIPGATWALLREWKECNPGTEFRPPKVDCPDCKNDPGYLYVWKTNIAKGNIRYRYCFRCLACKQGSLKIPFMLLKDLIEAGYEVDNPLRRIDRTLPRSIPKLVDTVIKRIK